MLPPAVVVVQQAQPVESICIEGEELKFSDELRAGYDALFASATLDPKRAEIVEHAITEILKGRGRYLAAGQPLGVPWYVVGIINYRECDCRLDCHLHNGDPLTARTVHVPAGRPVAGHPPFKWEDSARDALVYEGFDSWHDWSTAGTLFAFERFNGFGYRQFGINSPYVWSFTNHYTAGKYTSDGGFSRGAVDKQAGAAAILKRMIDQSLAIANDAAQMIVGK